MNYENGGLPEGWEWSDLTTICHKITDGTHHSPPKMQQTDEGDFKYITAKNIKTHGIIFDDVTYLSEDVHRPIYERCNPERDDVLYIKDGATAGVATVNQLDEEFSMLSSVALLKPIREAVTPNFLKWYLNSPTGFREMTSQMGGTAIKRLTLKKIKEGRFPVAPLAEQRRIVSKIESLQKRSSRARRALSEVGPLLEQFRQSVLQAAFSGRLTADWRAANPDVEPASELLARIRTERRHRWEQSELAKSEAKGKKPPKNWQDKYKEPVAAHDTSLPELPESWVWATLDELAAIGTGTTPRRNRPDFWENGSVPWIASAAVNHEFVTEASELVTQQALTETRLTLYPEGTLLIALYGEGKTRGKTTELMIPATINQALGAIQLSGIAASCKDFVKAAMIAQYERMRENSMGGVQPNLNLDKVRNIHIPLAPLADQTEILKMLDIRLGSVDDITNAAAESESVLTQLDQSILAKAFRGELVANEADLAASENRDYESAKVLLDRIGKELSAKRLQVKKNRKAKVRGKLQLKEKVDIAVKKNILNVLNESSTGLTPEELFWQAGYELDDIDAFYEQLRTCVIAGMICQEPNGPDPEKPKILLKTNRE